jgi:hypothetical protein
MKTAPFWGPLLEWKKGGFWRKNPPSTGRLSPPPRDGRRSEFKTKKRSIRTSAVAFAKIAIPLPFVCFASDAFLAAVNFANRLVSNVELKQADDDDDDAPEVAATAFDDFLCEETRANCEQAI